MQLALFLIFGLIAVGAAINLLVQRHPIYSALSLVAVMASLAVLYLMQGAEFIAFIQVLVYAGAIMVLFIFVIMVLNAGEAPLSRGSRMAAWAGLPVMALLLVELGALVWRQFAPVRVGMGDYYIPTAAIGNGLFRDFLLPFEVTSVLFLVGVLGAVVLARPQAPGKARQAAAGKEPGQ